MKAIPRTTAAMEPITVKNPLTPQAQNTSSGAANPRARSPSERAFRGRIPKGRLTTLKSELAIAVQARKLECRRQHIRC